MTVKAALANIIPDQKAGAIAHAAGLTEGDWCPVNFENFTSTKAEHVYVIGDAAIADGMPKSAFSAHSQAMAVAGHVLADLAQKERPEAKYRNTCWSWLAPDDSVKIGADYAPGQVGGKDALAPSGSFVSKPGEERRGPQGQLRRQPRVVFDAGLGHLSAADRRPQRARATAREVTGDARGVRMPWSATTSIGMTAITPGKPG